ncbi:hypothetical protein N2152v2_007259 [Parachlorella kessleri]
MSSGLLSQAARVVVVTGGIGAACSRLFAQQGARVVVADLQEDKGSSLATELGSEQALFVPCDVTKEADVAAAVQAAVDRFGGLHVMLNNAGVVGGMGPIEDMSAESFSRTLDINLKGVFHGIKHAARTMRSLGSSGSIINTSSIAGLAISGNWASAGYAASKSAVVALTKLAACELAPYGITVNALAPGVTATPMIGGFFLGDPSTPAEAVEQAVMSNSPVKGRTIRAQDIAAAALFLASEAGQAVNGHTLVVDLGTISGVTGQVPPMSQCPPQFFDHQGLADGEKFVGLAHLQAPKT